MTIAGAGAELIVGEGNDFDGLASERAPLSIEEILENPVRAYDIFKKRLIEEGPNASFPEFEEPFDFLWAKMHDNTFLEKVNASPALKLDLDEVKIRLAHVNLEFTFDDEPSYPYSLPFKGRFPYRPTIDAFEAALSLIDKVDRLDPDSNARPLYHMNRYAYHRHSLLADPDIVLFPTIRDLNFDDLIRVRAVPLGFVGIIDKTLRADRHNQSPLDFWFHDLNHVRRMCAYIAKRAEFHEANTDEEKLNFYRHMDDFVTQRVIPKISPLPEPADPNEQSIRKLARTIIFEIVHETALTIEPDTLLADLLRGPETQPFEHMMPPGTFEAGDTETLRTTTGNLVSGALGLSRVDGKPITIRYFYDRALGLLANVYNKLNYGFYDDPENPDVTIAPVEARKADFVVAAAQYLLRDVIGAEEIPPAAKLREMILSMEGSPEKFVYKRLQDHEGVEEQGPKVTEPMPIDPIINEFQRRRDGGQKVLSIFGYSILDYEDKRQAMAALRRDLEQLDPHEWIINIGATSDGIGAAYQIAREMGFTTTGIVSTQALSYSGQFSKFVSEIFIVDDFHWGGLLPGTNTLAPTTEAFLQVSDAIYAYGGGENTAVTMKEAKARGIEIRFTAAQMDHGKALKEAEIKHLTHPIDFNGAAHQAYIDLSA